MPRAIFVIFRSKTEQKRSENESATISALQRVAFTQSKIVKHTMYEHAGRANEFEIKSECGTCGNDFANLSTAALI